MENADNNLAEVQIELSEFGKVSGPLVKALDELPHDQIKLVLGNIDAFTNKFVSFLNEEIETYSKEKNNLEELSIEFPVELKNGDEFS